MRPSNKGFLLIDSLMSVFIVICMCVLCMTVYQVILRYDEGFDAYHEKTNDFLTQLFQSLPYCEACIVDEPD
ncbi:MAG: hypothetical protein IKS51_06110 [Erysipelotrichaceae bacterium]|nr:hypothetical protein [Erysipelotrichaceae bacterium]